MALHATDTASGHFFDLLSMYMVASFMAAYSLERFFRLRPVHFTLFFIIFLLSCIWAYFQPYQIIFDYFRLLLLPLWWRLPPYSSY